MTTPVFAPVFRALCPVVLASASPRRQLFLHELGLSFVCHPSTVPEGPCEPGEEPEAYGLRLAGAKAAQVAQETKDSLIIAADTLVVLREPGHAARILGKPKHAAEAFGMLHELSGRSHEVITAVHLVLPCGTPVAFTEATRVRFHPWADDVLRAYAATGEPFDKAGAYAIQGQGAFLVAEINGSWSTVVGLPVTRLVAELLKRELIKIF